MESDTNGSVLLPGLRWEVMKFMRQPALFSIPSFRCQVVSGESLQQHLCVNSWRHVWPLWWHADEKKKKIAWKENWKWLQTVQQTEAVRNITHSLTFSWYGECKGTLTNESVSDKLHPEGQIPYHPHVTTLYKSHIFFHAVSLLKFCFPTLRNLCFQAQSVKNIWTISDQIYKECY